ncbi:hypothetical protein [Kitasatospora herbaricolor]|uniref:hypothetical protein n=1 Tax=Kitasatospora herbaricolor TaxID=68217 RepID=UPI0036D9F1A1
MAEVPEQLRLALAEERTFTSPLARGLGAPTVTRNVSDSDLAVEGWDADPGLLAVRRPGRRPVGWIATAGDGGGWGTFVDVGPWPSQDPQQRRLPAPGRPGPTQHLTHRPVQGSRCSTRARSRPPPSARPPRYHPVFR